MVTYWNTLNQRKKLSENEARTIFTQVVDALEYAHNHSIFHRDIKLENILLDENNNVILGDWGFADYWSPDKTIKCTWGSLFYAAPEVFLERAYIGPEIDIWSLGVVLYAMVNGKLPFAGSDNTEIISNIVEGYYHTSITCSKSYTSLINSMLQVESAHRITIKEIRNHPWMLESVTSPVAIRKESIKFSKDTPLDSADQDESLFKREKKKSTLALLFQKLKPTKTSSKDVKKLATSSPKIDRKEKRNSVNMTEEKITKSESKNVKRRSGIGMVGPLIINILKGTVETTA